MTTEQLETLFFEVIQEKAIYNKLEGITENQIYNWRKQRTKPTIGDMVNVLYQLKKVNLVLSVEKNIERSVTIIVNNKVMKSIEDLTETVVDKVGKVYKCPDPVIRPNSNEPNPK